ncbi:sensor histidine kinase [Haloarcula laminariae]|uniref:sensor histidine kinase n=1 Tax=Haloarcula laminariae TaxID=2961577 RepID=UPI0024066FF1|nr:histidine kinase N-terminal 7TM domain-containing protein [Halomicroarcula sp. FL173]
MRPDLFGVGVIAASLVAGVGAVYLLQYLYGYRDKPGAAWFMGNIANVAVFCVTYGLSLLVFDPALRVAFETLSFISMCFMGPFFLAFGLDYTGRADLIRSPLFAVVMFVPLLTVGLTVTNATHGLVWSQFRLDPVFGLATVEYAIRPWGVFAILFCVGTAAVGSLLLVGAIISYGPLYRREVTAVILSTAPPTVGVLLWLFELGPAPQLHLTAPLMVVHVSLDLYAFVGTHMFDTNPATQRVAEQTGLDSLTEPVVVIDTQDEVVKLNDSAEELFGETAALPVPLERLTGVTLSTLKETGEVDIEGAHGGTFAVSYTPLSDPTGGRVGGMVVLYDLQEERRRKQQLSVLNRVLRHNLRNEMTVIQGFASSLEDSVGDPELQRQAGTIVRAGDRLLSIGEKVREFDRLQEQVLHARPVALDEVVAAVREEFLMQYPDATITTDIEVADPTVHAQPEVLELALSNLTENALKHASADGPRVGITVGSPPGDDSVVRLEVRDDNDRIPDSETAVLREGDETPLQHGQGIGLWVVNWCLTAVNGDVEYRYDDGNVFTLVLPRE